MGFNVLWLFSLLSFLRGESRDFWSFKPDFMVMKDADSPFLSIILNLGMGSKLRRPQRPWRVAYRLVVPGLLS